MAFVIYGTDFPGPVPVSSARVVYVAILVFLRKASRDQTQQQCCTMLPRSSPKHELELVLPWDSHRQQHRKKKQQRRESAPDYVQCVKYGVGIAAGITVVGWIKRKIQGIPVVGILATPFLCFMPTMLLGTAVGAAVVYGIEEGDPMAAQKKVLPKVKNSLESAHREVSAVASDIGRSLKDIHSQHMAAAEIAAREGDSAIARLASSLDAAAADAEASLGPVVQRHMAHTKRQIDKAAVEYDGWLQRQQRSSSSKRSRHVLSGTSSDD